MSCQGRPGNEPLSSRDSAAAVGQSQSPLGASVKWLRNRLPGLSKGMNALMAGVERTGCLAEADMNAELLGNVPRTRGSLGTSFRGCSAYASRVSRTERLLPSREDGTATPQSKGATMTGRRLSLSLGRHGGRHDRTAGGASSAEPDRLTSGKHTEGMLPARRLSVLTKIRSV